MHTTAPGVSRTRPQIASAGVPPEITSVSTVGIGPPNFCSFATCSSRYASGARVVRVRGGSREEYELAPARAANARAGAMARSAVGDPSSGTMIDRIHDPLYRPSPDSVGRVGAHASEDIGPYEFGTFVPG